MRTLYVTMRADCPESLAYIEEDIKRELLCYCCHHDCLKVSETPPDGVLTRVEVAQLIKDAARKAYADAQGSIFGQHKARGMMEAAKLFEKGVDNDGI